MFNVCYSEVVDVMQIIKLKNRKNALAIFMAFLLGILVSQVTSRNHSQPAPECGVINNELKATEVEWTDFPAWRQFSCELNGCFTVQLPHKKSISIMGMEGEIVLKELKRSSHLQGVATKPAIYDEVTYQIDHWNVISENIPKGQNEIADA